MLSARELEVRLRRPILSSSTVQVQYIIITYCSHSFCGADRDSCGRAFGVRHDGASALHSADGPRGAPVRRPPLARLPDAAEADDHRTDVLRARDTRRGTRRVVETARLLGRPSARPVEHVAAARAAQLGRADVRGHSLHGGEDAGLLAHPAVLPRGHRGALHNDRGPRVRVPPCASQTGRSGDGPLLVRRGHRLVCRQRATPLVRRRIFLQRRPQRQ